MWEAWTGQSAFAGLSFAEVLAAAAVHQARPPLPRDAPPELLTLMQACWSHEPTGRPAAPDCLAVLDAALAAALAASGGAAC